ncbi:DUF6624 domain-containing protein [Pedobacter sp.]|uniref:DUF6624 domain-containing protein n=1 Tax=Pedobacter sp. TaxID=1411316 RepID=UPI0031D287C2
MNKPIANELIAMAQHDLQVREELLKQGKLSPGYHPEMESVHRENAKRLDEIIRSIGYPTISKVGQEASDAAWLIVQHAISTPTLMKKCYALLSEAPNEVNPQNLAYLHDRICYFEGRPQKFGTQFDNRGLYPVEDKAEMIRLRETLNLSAHDENLIVECKDIEMNLHPHDKEFNLWRKKIGWI